MQRRDFLKAAGVGLKFADDADHRRLAALDGAWSVATARPSQA